MFASKERIAQLAQNALNDPIVYIDIRAVEIAKRLLNPAVHRLENKPGMLPGIWRLGPCDSEGILNLGVLGDVRSSSTRDKSWKEYPHVLIKEMIRSSRRCPPGISTVARGTKPNAVTPAMYAK
jgi:hypothetical protein